MNSKPLFAVVLAAGTSSRFGALKQLACYEGMHLVCRAVRLAENVCQEHSVLVTGHHWQEVHKACEPLRGFLINNDAFEAGMAGSIACGVRTIAETAGAVFLLLADQPLISAEYLQQMINEWDESAETIVCSEFGGACGPPVIFPAKYFTELVRLKGDQGARFLLEAHAEYVVRLPCENAAIDIDVPTDLAELNS